MQNSASNGTSLWILVRQIVEDCGFFVKEEAQLAKAELRENAANFARKAAPVAVGALVACAGLVALVIGIGMFGAFGMERLGLEPLLAAATGLGLVGLLVVALSALFIRKSLKAFSQQPFILEQNREPSRNSSEFIPGPQPAPSEPEDMRSSAEIKSSVMATECRLADALEKIERRVTLAEVREQANANIHDHPYRWSMIAMGMGIAGSYLLKGKVRPNVLKWSIFAARTLLPMLAVKPSSPRA